MWCVQGIELLWSVMCDVCRLLDSFPDDDESELSDSTLAEVWGTPPESIGKGRGKSKKETDIDMFCSYCSIYIEVVPVPLKQMM